MEGAVTNGSKAAANATSLAFLPDPDGQKRLSAWVLRVAQKVYDRRTTPPSTSTGVCFAASVRALNGLCACVL